MATSGKKYAVTNGPSFFEGILLEHWRDGNSGASELPTFTLEGGHTFPVRIHAIVNPPRTGKYMTIFIGEFAGEKIDNCPYFVMHYSYRGKRGGILEPLESLTTDNPILNHYFPDLFKPAPVSENPALAFLRSLPRERKTDMITDFLLNLFKRRPGLEITLKAIVSLLALSKQLSEEVTIEVDVWGDERAKEIFFALDNTRNELNAFLRELGENDYIGCGMSVAKTGYLFNTHGGIDMHKGVRMHMDKSKLF